MMLVAVAVLCDKCIISQEQISVILLLSFSYHVMLFPSIDLYCVSEVSFFFFFFFN